MNTFKLTTVKHIQNPDGYVIMQTIKDTWFHADMHNEVGFALLSSLFMKKHNFSGKNIYNLILCNKMEFTIVIYRIKVT